MKHLSTHVLDTAFGRPAAGVAVVLEALASDGTWIEKGRGTTDIDGRIKEFLPAGTALAAGDYRLRFVTSSYFQSLGQQIFYPEVHVHVRLDETRNSFHLPLVLSPFGYSTYRGS